ncbi:MAG: DUF2232 domain-containing protein [Clostridia bacterium]|nr:DUF2232 domain-containing protein [Clostridia bacterium]
MENRQFTFASQKNRWGFTVLSTILCILLGPFASALVLIPRMMTMLPLLLIILLGYVGIVSAVACTAILTAYASLLFGMWGAVGAFIFLLPPLITAAVSSEKNMSFWKASAINGLVMLLCEYIVLAIISMVAGQDAISATMQLFVDFFNENKQLTNVLVDGLMQSGLLTSSGSISSITQISDADRISILQGLIQSADQLLRLEVPMQIATGAVSVGLLGQFMIRKSMLKRGEKVDCPAFRTWCIPNGFGRVMAVTVLALYLISMVGSKNSAMFYVVSGVFEQFLALQGVAAMCYMLHRNGKTRGWQIVSFVIGYFFLNMAAVIIGIVDQAFDFTHRREEIAKIQEQQKRDVYNPRAGQDR